MTTSPLVGRGKTKSPIKEFANLQQAAPIRLKTVVRRLPPNLPESVFWQSVQPWVTEETASWKIFYQGKLRKKLNKENIPSRAYVLFKNEEDLALFSREYDGHVFRDKQGIESQAVVEFAPNQKVPPEKKKVDSRHATIHQDEDYISFVSSLQDPPTKPVEVDVDALLASTLPPEEPKTTPLLTALREQKQSAQEKKLAAAETGKGHSRKGGATAAAAQKQEIAESVPPPGKKSRKGKAPQGGGAAQPAASPPGVSPNPPSSKLSGAGGGGRSRPNSNQVGGASTSAAASSQPIGSPPGIIKDVTPPVVLVDGAEQGTRRNRPMLGLQSRHLKAALSGAGVGMQVPPVSPSTPLVGASSLSLASPAPGLGPALGPGLSGGSGSAPRAPRGRGGGEKRENAQKESGGGGRGGGKDKGRSRHGRPGSPAPSRPLDATPRILSRQDPPPPAFVVTDPPARDRVPSLGSQESGGGGGGGSGRGRGGRRGRGQS